jgi:acyl-coenzyme A synthetase/AMP-(fatty) acid ligase
MTSGPGPKASDTVMAVTTLSFDPHVWEIFGPLSVGGRLVVAGQEVAADGRALAQEISRYGATMMMSTPAVYRMLIEAGWAGSESFIAVSGGEPMTSTLAAELLSRVDALWNCYGPTEATVACTRHRVLEPRGPISIGKPIGNTRVYILDGNMQPVPIGVQGELYVGGAGIADGYLNRPALTANSFVPDPFGTEADSRLYRTGDLVRYRPTGEIEFVGRADNQVKIRGFRIELGEIESQLSNHPAIRDNVVILREDRPGDQRLAAYFVYDEEEYATVSELRKYLRATIPEYMIPQHFVELDSIPQTPNGKVDRKSLPSPLKVRTSVAEGEAPRTEIEKLVGEIWRDYLGIDRVRIHDNFFDLGGHSLLSLQVISRIERETGVRLSPRVMVQETLEQVARACENQDAEPVPNISSGIGPK